MRCTASYILLCLVFLCGCGSIERTSSVAGPDGLSAEPFTASLSTGSLVGAIGSTVSASVIVDRTSSAGVLSMGVSNLPAGVTALTSSPGAATSGTVKLSIGAGAAPGLYPLALTLNDGTYSVGLPMELSVHVASITVGNAVSGRFEESMSTNIPGADWETGFQSFPALAPQLLSNLRAPHVQVTPSGLAVAQMTADTWNFTQLDSFLQPTLNSSDHSPEFQLCSMPSFMLDPQTGMPVDRSFGQISAYAQRLVQYYNKGGFTAPDGFHVAPSQIPITYWGIWNEPNYAGMTAEQYVQLYNTIVPAMQAVDPTLKFVALELGDGDSQDVEFVPTFVRDVTAQVDVMATHFYSTSNHLDTDATLMATVPVFANKVRNLYRAMQDNPRLAKVPVWITENNVNGDYIGTDGGSAHNPGTPFVTDLRGSDAFFAAWRPYVFSQVGKAGAKALYHYNFILDPQYGEMNYVTGKIQLSYWVDYWLGRYFGTLVDSQMLQVTNTDEADIETLAVTNSDGSVLLMVVNHTVADPQDDDGTGAPREVEVDLSALGSISSATQLSIDSATSVSDGPVEISFDARPPVQLSFRGYGVTFLRLMR